MRTMHESGRGMESDRDSSSDTREESLTRVHKLFSNTNDPAAYITNKQKQKQKQNVLQYHGKLLPEQPGLRHCITVDTVDAVLNLWCHL